MQINDHFSEEDIQLLVEIEHQSNLLGDRVFDLAAKAKIESFALSLGSICNHLNRAAVAAGNVIDRIKYLEQVSGDGSL